MTAPAGPLRILMSRDASAKLGPEVARVLQSRGHVLVAPDEAQAAEADVAFISRDITGLSTKHRVLPQTQQVYDALQASRRLQWVHIHSAGADRPVFVDLRRRGVQVTTSSGANAAVVAQTALLGLLALARQWPRLLAAGLPRDLQGQTAVIVGWGPVGQALANLLQALGLNLVVVRRTEGADAGPGIRTVAPPRLHDVLPGADWLVLACPLTPQTRNLVGGRELALLPRHAGLVNVARGEVVDEAALIEALRDGRLGGAYLDVFATEPLAVESPLWDLPNVIVTPHSAGFSDGNATRVAQLFLDNLERWIRDAPLLNPVA